MPKPHNTSVPSIPFEGTQIQRAIITNRFVWRGAGWGVGGWWRGVGVGVGGGGVEN